MYGVYVCDLCAIVIKIGVRLERIKGGCVMRAADALVLIDQRGAGWQKNECRGSSLEDVVVAAVDDYIIMIRTSVMMMDCCCCGGGGDGVG